MRPRPDQSLYLCILGLMLFAAGETSRAAAALRATPIASSTAMTCDVGPRSTTEILTIAEAESSETVSI